MSKTIVLEPFSDWSITTDVGLISLDYTLARRSDRHALKIEFRNGAIFVILARPGDCDHELRCYDKLAEAVQFVDKYIDQNYMPAAEATRLLRETEAREKALQQQVAQLQASTVGQA